MPDNDIQLRIKRALEDYRDVDSVSGSFFCGWLRECAEQLAEAERERDELRGLLDGIISVYKDLEGKS